MTEFFRNFFSNQSFFERTLRGLLFGGAVLTAQAQTMPGGLTWKNMAAAGLATVGGMVAAGEKNPK